MWSCFDFTLIYPVVTHLLEEKKTGLNPDLIRDSKLRTPLLVACAAGQAAVVRQLIRYGADVNNAMGDIVGNKPLDLAVISNNVDTVLALLEAGAKVSNYAEQSKMQADDGLPLTVRLRAATRTPLDLANSRLDLLIKQSEESKSINPATMDQVLQASSSISIYFILFLLICDYFLRRLLNY